MEKEFHTIEIKEVLGGDVVRLDFRWKLEKGKIKEFAINLGLLEGEKSIDVFRADTAHGYLHEQRFWISPKPKSLELFDSDFNTAFIEKKREVFENYERWLRLFKEARKRMK